jgi:GxxExxY protein
MHTIKLGAEENTKLAHAPIGCSMTVHTALENSVKEVMNPCAQKIEMNKQRIGFQRTIEKPILYNKIFIGLKRAACLMEEQFAMELKTTLQFGIAQEAHAINPPEAYQLSTGYLINCGTSNSINEPLLNKNHLSTNNRYTIIQSY